MWLSFCDRKHNSIIVRTLLYSTPSSIKLATSEVAMCLSTTSGTPSVSPNTIFPLSMWRGRPLESIIHPAQLQAAQRLNEAEYASARPTPASHSPRNTLDIFPCMERCWTINVFKDGKWMLRKYGGLSSQRANASSMWIFREDLTWWVFRAWWWWALKRDSIYQRWSC